MRDLNTQATIELLNQTKLWSLNWPEWCDTPIAP